MGLDCQLLVEDPSPRDSALCECRQTSPVRLYIHRVWCTPLGIHELFREAFTIPWELPRGKTASNLSETEEAHVFVDLPSSPVYASGGLFGFWRVFHGEDERAQDAEGSSFVEAKRAERLLTLQFLRSLFPSKRPKDVLQVSSRLSGD